MNTKRKRRYFYHDMANHLQVASHMSPEDGNAYLEEMIQKSGIKLKNIKHTDQTEAFGELMKCLDRLQDQKVGSEKPPDRRELAVQYLIESKKQECVRNKLEADLIRIQEVEECLVADVVRKKHVTINVYMKLENGQQEQRVKKSVYDIVLLP